MVHRGTVLPGPALWAPYVNQTACVMWAAARHEEGPVTASAVVPFRLRLVDGREVAVLAAGAAARLPVRARLAFGLRTKKGEDKPGTELHLVAWLAPDDDLFLDGTLSEPAGPLRGVPVLLASKIDVRMDAAAAALRVVSLAAAEPET